VPGQARQMTDDRPGRMPLAMLATSLDRALYAGRPARIATHSESKRRAGRYRHPILLLITSLIDTNRSMGGEAGLPPRFAGRIPHPAEAGVRCNIVHCRPRCVPPRYWDVHCHRGRCCRDPRGLRPGGRAVGCYRVAPAVPRDHRQREGTGNARSIAGWTPLPVQPRPVTRLRPRKNG
jgi:hypothetical protein